MITSRRRTTIMAEPTKGVNPFAKKVKQKDPTTPFPAPNEKMKAKKKKASAKIDTMLMKSMPGISMNSKKKKKVGK